MRLAMSRRAVLVTGSIRSGTTFVGRALATAREAVYLHEPFNPDSPWNAAFPLPMHYFHVAEHNAAVYRERFRKVLALEPVIRGKWQDERRAERYAFLESQAAGKGGRKRATPVVKDPVALFSAPWLVRQFRVRPIVVVRSPDDVLASIIRLGWAGNMTLDWLDCQPVLRASLDEMAGALGMPLLASSLGRWHELLGAVQVTRVCYLASLYYVQHLDYRLACYERLTRNPAQEFADLFRYAGLTPSRHTRETVFSTVSDAFDVASAHQNTAAPVSVDEIRKRRGAGGPRPFDDRKVRAAFDDIRARFADAVDW